MRLPIGARRAPSEGYRDSGLVQSQFRDALIASRHHFRYWHEAQLPERAVCFRSWGYTGCAHPPAGHSRA
jgi:hypothetical protein